VKNTLFVATALALLLAQSALSTLVPFHPFVPNVLLPMVLYLGVTPDVTLVRGSTLAFVLGVLADELTGAPLGLDTFLFVAAFLLTRVAGLRLFLRGVPFQIAATTGIAMVASGAMLALCAIFEQGEAFPLAMPPAGLPGALAESLFGDDVPLVGSATHVASVIAATGFSTGLVSPLVYAATRRIESVTVRARRSPEGGATA
jgi:rod shape-determining protein MreD